MQKFWEIPILGNVKMMKADEKAYMLSCNLITIDKPEMVSCRACNIDIFNEFELIDNHVESLEHLNNLVHKLQTRLNTIVEIPKSPLGKIYLDVHKMTMYKMKAVFCHICDEKIVLTEDMDLASSVERHITTSPLHVDYIFKFFNQLHVGGVSSLCNDLERRKKLSDKLHRNVKSSNDENIVWPQDYAPYSHKNRRYEGLDVMFNRRTDFLHRNGRFSPIFQFYNLCVLERRGDWGPL